MKQMTVKEKNARKRHWSGILFIGFLLFLAAALFVLESRDLDAEGHFYACALSAGAILFWVMTVAVWNNISETGIAGEFAVFIYWIIAHSNAGFDDYIWSELITKGGGTLFFIFTVIGWLMRVKDVDRARDVLLAFIVLIFVWLMNDFFSYFTWR